MTRPTWNQTFMEMCYTLSKRSTCCRLQTAAIITKNNVIVSVGYNGSTPGAEHCCDYWKQQYNFYKNEAKFAMSTSSDALIDLLQGSEDISFSGFLETKLFGYLHHEWSIQNEHHGEMNAILFAAKDGISLKGTEMYTIYSPCINCAKSIVTAGIQKVYYDKLYKRDCSGIDFLRSRGVVIFGREEKKHKFVSIGRFQVYDT